MSTGGLASAAVLPSWPAGQALGSGSFYPNIPAGIVVGVYSEDPGGGNRLNPSYGYLSVTYPGE